MYKKVITKFPDVKIKGISLLVGKHKIVEVIEFINSQKPEYPNKRINFELITPIGDKYQIESAKDVKDVINYLNKEK
ncbi:hypothetical protein [Methanobacterium sp. BAmetb5]|uniref:hypothetical protein n=1 Tax=Methanobacterium sp. BAmetb5 TaxID=2025351 RepID=UPI000E837FDF|nr:hypothetical protein [Methanobacterium sp. BAmetb5]AXV39439.1 MAG: hypothetical protein CIT02_03490 [Methanobacterium sp. BAmetb5]